MTVTIYFKKSDLVQNYKVKYAVDLEYGFVVLHLLDGSRVIIPGADVVVVVETPTPPAANDPQ